MKKKGQRTESREMKLILTEGKDVRIANSQATLSIALYSVTYALKTDLKGFESVLSLAMVGEKGMVQDYTYKEKPAISLTP